MNTFETLYESARPDLMRQALVLCPCMEDAEDLVQECALAAYRQFASFDTDKAFSLWTTSILFNLHKNLRRGRERKHAVSLDELVGMGFDWEDPAAISEECFLLNETIELLSEEEREIIDTCLEGEPPKSHADRTRRCLARRALRTALG